MWLLLLTCSRIVVQSSQAEEIVELCDNAEKLFMAEKSVLQLNVSAEMQLLSTCLHQLHFMTFVTVKLRTWVHAL